MADSRWFAGRLRELREAAGLDRKQLAERAGLRSEGGVRDIEQGLSMPRWDTVLALCAALGCTPLEFMKEPGPLDRQRGGRPKKAKPAPETPAAPPRPRGRPRKGQ